MSARLIVNNFLLILFVYGLSSCNCTKERNAPPPSETLSTPKRSAQSVPIEPLPAPRTYFGDLGKLHITTPVEYTPVSNRSVLLIVIDTLNVRHLSPYGYGRDTSSNLRALAEGGLMLTNHISNSSWTRPSITTIMTGLTKQQHGVELNGQHLKEEVTTVAERFKDAGYRTGGFVGNPLVRKIWGFGQGFQVFEDLGTYKKAFPSDKILADAAIRWLDKDKSAPFYMMIFFTAPHAPYRPPERFRKFLHSVKEGPVVDYPFKEYIDPLPQDDQDRIIAAYDGEIAFTDSQVGRIISYLKETARLENTSVVVTADHGELLGQHNCYGHTWHMWEQALRVPLIISSPGLSPASGKIDDRPFSHPDIAPTLYHLAGLSYTNSIHLGVSIIERLKDPGKGRTRTLFSQYNAHGVRRQALRKGPLKLVHHHLVPKSALRHLDDLNPGLPSASPDKLPSLALERERFELYNLVSDPDELEDVFERNRGTKEVDELLNALSSVMTKPAKPLPTLSEETLEALRNAGYIQ